MPAWFVIYLIPFFYPTAFALISICFISLFVLLYWKACQAPNCRSPINKILSFYDNYYPESDFFFFSLGTALYYNFTEINLNVFKTDVQRRGLGLWWLLERESFEVKMLSEVKGTGACCCLKLNWNLVTVVWLLIWLLYPHSQQLELEQQLWLTAQGGY